MLFHRKDCPHLRVVLIQSSAKLTGSWPKLECETLDTSFDMLSKSFVPDKIQEEIPPSVPRQIIFLSARFSRIVKREIKLGEEEIETKILQTCHLFATAIEAPTGVAVAQRMH